MTKKEFQTIEKQLRQNLGELNKTQKKHLGLPDNSSFLQTIPIDEFEISEVGISEKERITGVRKQNINTQQQRDEIEKEKMKRIDHVTKEEAKKWNKTEEEVLKKSLIISNDAEVNQMKASLNITLLQKLLYQNSSSSPHTSYFFGHLKI